LVRPLEGADRKASAGEAAFTSSSGDRRGSPVTRMRNLAVRRDEKPRRAGSSSPGWFRVRANRSYPEGIRLLLCASTVESAWAVPSRDWSIESRRKADNDGVPPGRSRCLGRTRENLPKRRRCYKRLRWLVSQRQPER
jgi:hypothetical protein